MQEIMSKYAFPFSDYSFKRLFGRNTSKKSLIDFLNALIKPEKPIVSIVFLNVEAPGRTVEDRKSVFDIYCETANGNKFVIEIQQVHTPYLMDRIIYYSTIPIQDQSKKGKWNFNIRKTYMICLLNDCFDKEHSEKVVHTFKLIDTENKTELEQLVIYNIELPKFKKTEKELTTRLDIWLYVLNNLIIFGDIPDFLKEDEIFKEFFMNAEIAKFHRDEYMAYIASMKEVWEENAWLSRIEELKDNLWERTKELSATTEELSATTEELSATKEKLTQIEDKLLFAVQTMLAKNIDIKIIQDCTGMDLNVIQSLAGKKII